MMKIITNSKKLLFGVLMMVSCAAYSQCPNITWADEFDGTTLDLTKWNYQTGDGCAEGICGWGNNELQSYQQDNVVVENGLLRITARKERIRGSQYTSGRINSKGKGDFTYGRFEASIKLPAGDGLWPAFWMLSTDEVYGGWPQSGEIDIMEFTSSEPDNVYGTIHYGDLYPGNQFQGNEVYLYEGTFPEAYHEFAIEWEPGEIRWYLDGVLFSTKTEADVAPYNWPFDQNFHFLLNVAVGGTLGGPVDDSMLPATMEIDYVRVFDGFKPTLQGDDVVSNQGNGSYQIANLSNGVNVNWIVPAGATIVSGQGTKDVSVDFGNSSGYVTATFDAGCGAETIAMGVEVEPPYSYGFSFENFESAGNASFASSTGSLNEVSNPSSDGVNSSATVGEYVRNGGEQYDLLVYNTSAIVDADSYSSKANKFYMDVYTSAPVGTPILIQLETSSATSSNYPAGRHSRYVAEVQSQNSWNHLEFSLLDQPDGAADPTDVSSMIVLFNSNTFTSDTYYFDNFDSYAAGTGTPQNQVPIVSLTSPADQSTFDTGSSITVSADASDSDGSVSSVSFYSNGNLINTDTNGPWETSWTVASGSTLISAIATDNEGAVSSEVSISVTGQDQSGEASAILVNAIVTGTISAGQGSKYGSAEVTITDDMGNPISGASVNATFSGTFNESASATTYSSGVAVLQTASTAKGGVTVNVCVDNVVGALPYDPAQNVITCTGGGARTVSNVIDTKEVSVSVYPNPVKDYLYINYGEMKNAIVRLYNFSGQQVMELEQVTKIDLTGLNSGIYLLELIDAETHLNIKIVK